MRFLPLGPAGSVAALFGAAILVVTAPPPLQQSARAQAVTAAAAPSLAVMALRVDGPVAVGRFATVTFTLRNDGAQPVTLRRAGVTLRGTAGGAAAGEPSQVGPFGPALPATLKPGATLTLQRFVRTDQPGAYAVAVVADAGKKAGAWAPLTGAGATDAALRVMPAAILPQVSFSVADPAPHHIYRAGATIRLQVQPIVTAGDDLAASVGEIAVTPGAKPHSLGDPAAMRELLSRGVTSGKTPTVFLADFFGVDDDHKYLDIALPFTGGERRVSAVRLAGFNENGQFGVKSCEVYARRPDGTEAALPAATWADGSSWSIVCGLKESVAATALRVRIHAPYKVEITGITIQGQAAGTSPAASGTRVTCRWTDGFGKYLSAPQELAPFQTGTVTSPANLAPGYYGLQVTSSLPGAREDRREYGFVVLPASAGTAPGGGGDPRLGLVHMPLDETNLGVGLVKSMAAIYYDSAKETLDTAAWVKAVNERQQRSLEDLPLVSRTDWTTDSTRPVSDDELRKLRVKMRQYFAANPTYRYWELGLEENLGYRRNRGKWPYYFSNLEAKARAVRQAAEDAHADVKLIFQIAEVDPKSAAEFLGSPAAKQFDILSLHPYAWPDFESPEKWMPPYLATVRSLMAKNGLKMPIWYTEIGAPLNGNPGGFFGYPKVPVFDRGLSRDEHAAYLVRCHLEALREGVERIFWYNYRDAGQSPEYAEDHFGMIDFRGYPKPSYAAYATMARLLGGRAFASAALKGRDVQVYRFAGKDADVVAVWTYPTVAKTVRLADLGLVPVTVTAVTDIAGKPLAVGPTVAVSGYPIYLTVRHGGLPAGKVAAKP